MSLSNGESKWRQREESFNRKLSSVDSTHGYRDKIIMVDARRNEDVRNNAGEDEAKDDGHGREYKVESKNTAGST